MSSEISKTSRPHVLMLNLIDKTDLQRGEKTIALSNLTIYYTWKNIKNSYKNNKFEISAPTWNDKYELPGESYSVSNTQGDCEYIIKKHEAITDNLPKIPYVNEIENRITFKNNLDIILSL